MLQAPTYSFPVSSIYLFCNYLYNNLYTSELASLVPPPHISSRLSRLSFSHHPRFIYNTKSHTNQYAKYFLLRTLTSKNLFVHVSPADVDMQQFIRRLLFSCNGANLTSLEEAMLFPTEQ